MHRIKENSNKKKAVYNDLDEAIVLALHMNTFSP
jgi:predicted secreted acid phosphatase